MNAILKKILPLLKHRNWVVYDVPYKLNIVGIRSPYTKPNSFDDVIVVFYKDNKDNWQVHTFPATTDPGTYWLNQPMQPQGTAIMAEGQYIEAYGISLHRGQYYALCQIHKPVTVIRDYDRDAILDFQNGERTSGMYGINIHRANSTGTTYVVNMHSAGCQVFQKIEDFNRFMELCEVHRKLHQNHFTYSLIDFRALLRNSRKRKVKKVGIAAGITAVLVLLGIIALGD